MHNLINGIHGMVHIDQKPLVCTCGREEFNKENLGYTNSYPMIRYSRFMRCVLQPVSWVVMGCQWATWVTRNEGCTLSLTHSLSGVFSIFYSVPLDVVHSRTTQFSL